MKAIETRYKGYRFRSRLEARWAVFFDAMGYSWQYEPEGFETPAGWYLPDFKVNGIWVEVKPGEPSGLEIEKCRCLQDGTEETVLIVCGNPWPGEYFIRWVGMVIDHVKFEFATNRHCGGLAVRDGEFFIPMCLITCKPCGIHDMDQEDWQADAKIHQAFSAARAARFQERSCTTDKGW